jgi:hypothetical protein
MACMDSASFNNNRNGTGAAAGIRSTEEIYRSGGVVGKTRDFREYSNSRPSSQDSAHASARTLQREVCEILIRFDLRNVPVATLEGRERERRERDCIDDGSACKMYLLLKSYLDGLPQLNLRAAYSFRRRMVACNNLQLQPPTERRAEKRESSPRRSSLRDGGRKWNLIRPLALPGANVTSVAVE